MRSGDSCAGRSSKKLEDTRRIVAETEEVGIAVLDTLAQQRESLLGTHEKVRSSLDISHKLCNITLHANESLVNSSLARSARREQ